MPRATSLRSVRTSAYDSGEEGLIPSGRIQTIYIETLMTGMDRFVRTSSPYVQKVRAKGIKRLMPPYEVTVAFYTGDNTGDVILPYEGEDIIYLDPKDIYS